LVGGLGNDTYVIDASDTVTENPGEGSDTIALARSVNLAEFPNIENVTLTGTGAFNATGNAQDNLAPGGGIFLFPRGVRKFDLRSIPQQTAFQ